MLPFPWTVIEAASQSRWLYDLCSLVETFEVAARCLVLSTRRRRSARVNRLIDRVGLDDADPHGYLPGQVITTATTDIAMAMRLRTSCPLRWCFTANLRRRLIVSLQVSMSTVDPVGFEPT